MLSLLMLDERLLSLVIGNRGVSVRRCVRPQHARGPRKAGRDPCRVKIDFVFYGGTVRRLRPTDRVPINANITHGIKC